jgi:hypothetical protein
LLPLTQVVSHACPPLHGPPGVVQAAQVPAWHQLPAPHPLVMQLPLLQGAPTPQAVQTRALQ